MFAVIGSLCTGNGDLTMKAVYKIHHALINEGIEHMLFTLDEVLGNIYLMDDEEKQLCRGKCQSDPDVIYSSNGVDFSFEEEKEMDVPDT